MVISRIAIAILICHRHKPIDPADVLIYHQLRRVDHVPYT
jgi:hypothetical protein